MLLWIELTKNQSLSVIQEKPFIKEITMGGWRDGSVRAQAALTEAPGSIPSTYVVAQNFP